MTYLQPGGPSAPTARIRILGCDPPPPPRRDINGALVAACVAAAGLGIAAAVVGRQLLAGPEARPQATPAVTGVGVQAFVGSLPQRHRPVVRRALRASVEPVDLRAAARAARRTAVITVTAGAATPVQPAEPIPVTVPAPSSGTDFTPATAAPGAPAAPAQAPPVRDTVTQPHLPPDPTDPNTTIDQP